MISFEVDKAFKQIFDFSLMKHMNKTLVASIKNKKGVMHKSFAFLITAVVIAVLVISGPAQAMSLNLAVDGDSTVVQGKKIKFIATVNLSEQYQNLPIEMITLNLVSAENNESISCSFDITGKKIKFEGSDDESSHDDDEEDDEEHEDSNDDEDEEHEDSNDDEDEEHEDSHDDEDEEHEDSHDDEDEEHEDSHGDEDEEHEDSHGDEDEDDEIDKIKVCHIPPGNSEKAHIIKIGESAVDSHLAHGDTLGKCPKDKDKHDEEHEGEKNWQKKNCHDFNIKKIPKSQLDFGYGYGYGYSEGDYGYGYGYQGFGYGYGYSGPQLLQYEITFHTQKHSPGNYDTSLDVLIGGKTFTTEGTTITILEKKKDKDNEKKVKVCHIPPGNHSNAHDINIDESAVPAHLAHGDLLGKCKDVLDDEDEDNDDKKGGHGSGGGGGGSSGGGSNSRSGSSERTNENSSDINNSSVNNNNQTNNEDEEHENSHEDDDNDDDKDKHEDNGNHNGQDNHDNSNSNSENSNDDEDEEDEVETPNLNDDEDNDDKHENNGKHKGDENGKRNQK